MSAPNLPSTSPDRFCTDPRTPSVLPNPGRFAHDQVLEPPAHSPKTRSMPRLPGIVRPWFAISQGFREKRQALIMRASRPSRARGLKQFRRRGPAAGLSVAPLAGAWIEGRRVAWRATGRASLSCPDSGLLPSSASGSGHWPCCPRPSATMCRSRRAVCGGLSVNCRPTRRSGRCIWTPRRWMGRSCAAPASTPAS